MDSMETHGESPWSPHGVCGNVWGSVKYSYFHRGPKSDDNFPEPRTPTRVPGRSASVSELPAPQRVKAPRKFILTVSKPPGNPSDDSSSESDSKPIKPPIPPRSDKRPATVATTTDLKPKCYHFDLKLKPESVPQ